MELEDILIYDNLAHYDEKIKEHINGKISAQDSKINNLEASKQDTIQDLDNIRSGANKGSSALQPEAISDMETKAHASETYATKEHLHNVEETFSTALDDIDASLQKNVADCNKVKDEIYSERDSVFLQMDKKLQEVKDYADQQIERLAAAEETIAEAWDNLDYRLRQLETA